MTDLMTMWYLMVMHTLKIVDSFCYLGDTISAVGGCGLETITGVRIS